MALSDFFQPCVMMDRITTTDPLAGIVQSWQEGAEFEAGIASDATTTARIAYQQGARRMYTVVTPENILLEPGDRIKRKADGLLIKITSYGLDMTPPGMSDIRCHQVSGEAVTV